MHVVYLLFKLYVRIIESDMHIIYRLRAWTVQLRVDRHIETCKEKLKLWSLNVKSKTTNLTNNLYEKKEVSEKIYPNSQSIYIILMSSIYLCFLYTSACLVWILFGLDSSTAKSTHGNNLKSEQKLIIDVMEIRMGNRCHQ